jgi:hypothetical protein
MLDAAASIGGLGLQVRKEDVDQVELQRCPTERQGARESGSNSEAWPAGKHPA